MFATGVTMGLAKWTFDDTYLVREFKFMNNHGVLSKLDIKCNKE